MKRKLTPLFITSCLIALLAAGGNSLAQEKKPRPDESNGPADGTFKVLASKPVFGRVVKGAPYSATATTETIQTLSDGNQIVRKNESKLYRDSEGRIRKEQTLETIGKWTADGEAQQRIFINDPVAGVSYSLDPRTHTFQKTAIPQKKVLVVPNGPNGTFVINGQTEFEAGMEKKLKAHEELLAKEGKEAPNAPELKTKLEMMQQAKVSASQRKTESLGTQTIEGVTVEGTRSTITILAGEIGNTLPIEIVDESWYSRELQLMVMTRHRDPRSGENTYRLTNLNRSEPDRSLFEVPADYTVREDKLPSKPRPIKEEQ